MLSPLNQENAYTNASDLPNANPRWPHLSTELPDVYFFQAALVIVRGLNLNKYCPVH